MPVAGRCAAERAAADPADPLASPLGWLRPIDSEHSAIWQCLAGEDLARVDRLVLTASGGPFLDLPADEFAAITPEQALRHPTWSMGAKITIDSATLANKGLEVIEARWLYDVAYEQIDVVIHPQSVVHSAVQFVDGSLKAQLGTPDMRLPIQYALTYPDRRPSPAAAPDLVAVARLDFRAPDEDRFPALRIAREAGPLGPRATAALIAADDVAVARFLDGTPGLPGHPADARGRGGALRRGRRRRIRTSRSSSRSIARSAPRSRRASWGAPDGRHPLRRSSRSSCSSSSSAASCSSTSSATSSPPGLLEGPGPGVRHRLPAAGQGPALEGRDPVHPQLAADRRLRPHGRRGRRCRGRPALVRGQAAARPAGDPRRRRGDEHRPRVRDLLRHRLAGDARSSA